MAREGDEIQATVMILQLMWFIPETDMLGKDSLKETAVFTQKILRY